MTEETNVLFILDKGEVEVAVAEDKAERWSAALEDALELGRMEDR